MTLDSNIIKQASAVIFDMDGVLVDSEPWWLVALDTCFTRSGVFLTQADYLRTTGQKLVEVVDYWMQQKDFGDTQKETLVSDIYEEVYELVTQKSGLIPGVKKQLINLKEHNIPIALASSSSLGLITKLMDYYGLTSYFDVIQSADDCKLGKPNPEVFLRAMQRMGISDPLDCIVIEDSINGIVAAKAAKMKCIAIPDFHKKELPQFSLADKVIFYFDELKNDWWMINY